VSVKGLDIQYAYAGETGEAVMDKLSVAFERAGDNIRDFGRYVFPKLSPVFEAAEERQFAAEGAGPNRGKWAPLTAKYAEWKGQHYPGNPILVASGRMREALTQSSSPFARRVTSGDTFDFGTEGVPYASFHQLGTSRMVDRALFDFGSDFESDLREAALDGVREAVADAGAPEVTGGA
jgi:phage gpG-like protein